MNILYLDVVDPEGEVLASVPITVYIDGNGLIQHVTNSVFLPITCAGTLDHVAVRAFRTGRLMGKCPLGTSKGSKVKVGHTITAIFKNGLATLSPLQETET